MTSGSMIIEQGVVAGNVTDKYGTRNPIARRLMDGFLKSFDDLASSVKAQNAHEVGCGEGHLLTRLDGMGINARGSDFSLQILDIARQTLQDAGVDAAVRAASVYDLTPAEDAAELIVCCEVLEHLEHPADALKILAELAQPHLLLSVPREPLWRGLNMARGKYIRDRGNTPGHLNHWSRHGFIEFLSRVVDVTEVRSPLPWTMALCRRRGS